MWAKMVNVRKARCERTLVGEANCQGPETMLGGDRTERR